MDIAVLLNIVMRYDKAVLMLSAHSVAFTHLFQYQAMNLIDLAPRKLLMVGILLRNCVTLVVFRNKSELLWKSKLQITSYQQKLDSRRWVRRKYLNYKLRQFNTTEYINDFVHPCLFINNQHSLEK